MLCVLGVGGGGGGLSWSEARRGKDPVFHTAPPDCPRPPGFLYWEVYSITTQTQTEEQEAKQAAADKVKAAAEAAAAAAAASKAGSKKRK